MFFLFFLELINPEDQTLSFVSTMNSDALLAVEVKPNEFLLCFAGKQLFNTVLIMFIASLPHSIGL